MGIDRGDIMSPRRSLGLFNNKFTFSLSFFEVNEIKKGRVLKIFSLGLTLIL